MPSLGKGNGCECDIVREVDPTMCFRVRGVHLPILPNTSNTSPQRYRPGRTCIDRCRCKQVAQHVTFTVTVSIDMLRPCWSVQ